MTFPLRSLVTSFWSLILFILGWQPLPSIPIPRRSIFIFSHTSYWDFFLFLLYKGAYPAIFGSVFTLVKPQAFERWGWFLTRWGCLPATPREVTGGGSIDRLVATLRDKEKFIFLLSPEGSRHRQEWRSGYRVLASQLDVPIWVGGLDYEKKKIFLARPQPSDSREDLLQGIMSQIVPLHPERSFVRVRPHQRHLVSVVDWQVMTSVVAMIGIVISLWSVSGWLALAGGVTGWFSCLYHRSQESQYQLEDRWFVRLMVGLLIISRPGVSFEVIAWGLVTLLVYWKAKGEGREITGRSVNYMRWHPWFHLLVMVTVRCWVG